VLLVVAVIIVTLLLTSGWLYKFTVMQRGLARRALETRIAKNIAQGLAVLSLQKIAREELTNPGSELSDYLSKPLSGMGDLSRQGLFLEQGATSLAPVLAPLLEPLADLGTYSYSVAYEAKQQDFSPCGLNAKFPREKRGLLHLHVAVSYGKHNGPSIIEEYHYVAPLKVVAALVPVLSKFTLYVENAQEGNPFRFNLVSTDQNGSLSPTSSAKPFILDNGGENRVDSTLAEFVRKERGLVYLGGGPIVLNLARGWGSNPEFGEGFHLFEKGRGDGLYTIDWKGHMALLNWDQGICIPPAAGAGRDWFEFVEKSPQADQCKVNSIFRLFGTDTRISPTLVLGQVYRGMICARAFKSIQTPPPFMPGFLPYIKDQAVWDTSCQDDPPEGYQPLKPFVDMTELKSMGASQQMSKYQETYASNYVSSQPFDLGLAFMATNNRHAFPLQGSFGAGDDLATLMKANPAPSAELTKTIPAEYRILDGVTSLESMQAFLDGMAVPGERAAWVVPAGEAGDPLVKLKRRGLVLSDGSSLGLDLNGWVYLEGQNTLTLDQNVQVVSNGGIVLEKGNIVIRKPIRAGDRILQLVTRDGFIRVEGFFGDVEASLVAGKGKVVIGPGAKPVIKGSVAMASFDIPSSAQGGTFKYNPALSARPGATTDAESEKGLLTFSLDPNPLLVQ